MEPDTIVMEKILTNYFCLHFNLFADLPPGYLHIADVI